MLFSEIREQRVTWVKEIADKASVDGINLCIFFPHQKIIGPIKGANSTISSQFVFSLPWNSPFMISIKAISCINVEIPNNDKGQNNSSNFGVMVSMVADLSGFVK
jgi:hypothetical protein